MAKKRRASSPKDTSSSRRWLWIGLVAAVFLLVIAPLTAVGVSIHLENNQAFCAGCHTQPETTYVDRATAPQPADLASAHAHGDKAIACIQCHSGEGTQGRADALMLGARDLAAYVRGNYPQPTVITRAIPDSNCLKCHGDIANSDQFENHFHTLLGRWRQASPDSAASCVDCHSAHKTNGDATIAFLNKNDTVIQCNNCHRLLGD